ncbi:MAG: ABC transporter permease, partial [Tissierellia bacterium]|nr:ABC transporter permease [Tissierellia bacterium]
IEGVDEEAFSNELMTDKSVNSVIVYSNLAKDFEDQVKSLNAIVLLIIISAGILAFVVLYNLININISERIREIATIKVLGFYDKEVSTYVFREIFILSLLGTLVGLVLGIGLHKVVMLSIEQEDIMFGYSISPLSFLYAFLLTFIFTVLVNLFMTQRLRSIHMVESLKSIE